MLAFDHWIGPGASISRATGTLDDPGYVTHNGATVLRIRMRNGGPRAVTIRAVGVRTGRWPRRRVAWLLPDEPFTLQPSERREWDDRWSAVCEALGREIDVPMIFRPIARVPGRRPVSGQAITTTGREVPPAVVKHDHVLRGRR